MKKLTAVRKMTALLIAIALLMTVGFAELIPSEPVVIGPEMESITDTEPDKAESAPEAEAEPAQIAEDEPVEQQEPVETPEEPVAPEEPATVEAEKDPDVEDKTDPVETATETEDPADEQETVVGDEPTEGEEVSETTDEPETEVGKEPAVDDEKEESEEETEVGDTAEDLTEEEIEDEEPADEITYEEIAIKRLEVETDDTVQAGGTMDIEIELRSANADGASLKDFTIEIKSDLDWEIIETNAVEKRDHKILIENAVISSDKVTIGGRELRIRIRLSVPEEEGVYVFNMKIFDSNDEEVSPKEEKLIRHNFTVTVASEEALEETPEEIEEPVIDEIQTVEIEEPVEETKEEPADEPSEEPADELEEEPADEPSEEPEEVVEKEPIPEPAEEELPGKITDEEPILLELKLSDDPTQLEDGDLFTMTAVISGLDPAAYTVYWECDGGTGDWQRIEDAEGYDYTVEITGESRGCSWRYVVDIH